MRPTTIPMAVRCMSLLVLVALVGACGGAQHPPADAPDPTATAAIEALLDELVEAWNRDDLRGHVEGYSPSATYTTARGLVTGHAAIEQQMRGFVTPDGLAGELAFDDVMVRLLGRDHALATGAFLVEDVRDTIDIRGRFTLVLERTPEGWRAIHDHSS